MHNIHSSYLLHTYTSSYRLCVTHGSSSLQNQSSAGSHPSDGSEPTIGSISQLCSHAKLLLSSAKKKAGFPGAQLIRNWWGRWENWTDFMGDTTSLCVQPRSLNSYQQFPKPKQPESTAQLPSVAITAIRKKRWTL